MYPPHGVPWHLLQQICTQQREKFHAMETLDPQHIYVKGISERVLRDTLDFHAAVHGTCRRETWTEERVLSGRANQSPSPRFQRETLC